MTCITSGQTLVSDRENSGNHHMARRRQKRVLQPVPRSTVQVAPAAQRTKTPRQIGIRPAIGTERDQAALSPICLLKAPRLLPLSGIEWHVRSNGDAIDAYVDSMCPDHARAHPLRNLDIYHFGKGKPRSPVSKLSNLKSIVHNSPSISSSAGGRKAVNPP